MEKSKIRKFKNSLVILIVPSEAERSDVVVSPFLTDHSCGNLVVLCLERGFCPASS